MTIRKEYPPRNYETFPESDEASDAANSQSRTQYNQGGDADKSRSAAAEAQRLASQGSWADNFAGGTPATNQTPAASTIDGDEVRSVGYPHLQQDADPSDPPPVYTPSASTQTPPSPVAARSVPAPGSEPVSAPVSVSSPSHPRCSHPAFRDGDEEEVSSSSLPEPGQHQHPSRDEYDDDEEADPESLPVFMQQQGRAKCSKRRWCRPHATTRGCRTGHVHGRARARGCHDKERARRFKRTIFFILALLACLWLMIPGLCKSLSNDGRYQLPNFGPRPSDTPWPPPEREHREKETSHSITGTFKLYDLLDLSTTSGSISVTVDIQPGEKPAVLRLGTGSGSVRVKMSTGGGLFHKPTLSDAAQSRILRTVISTQSGSVSGDVVHGNGGTTDIDTNSGSIHLTIYTAGVSELDPQSNLSTSTGSGSQVLKVVPPLGSTEAVRAIQASHVVRGSGSMSLQYPMEWEGMVHIKVHGSGSVMATGAGLDVRRESRQELNGYRGSKAGKTIEVAELGSGSVRFVC